jgi:hypothetical protein
MGGAICCILSVVGAEEICLLSAVIICYAVIQLFTAVPTVKQTRKHTDCACAVWPAFICPKRLYKFPRFPVNNGFVSILKDFSFFLWSLNFCFILE